MTQTPEPELSRPLVVDRIPVAGMEQDITADAQERKALAKRFELLDLPKLEAQLTITRAGLEGSYDVKGQLQAEVMQSCVVTLEPLPATITQKIAARFEPVPDGALEPEDEEAEPIRNGVIELGEMLAQILGLALDPYPRKPGLVFEPVEIGGKAAAAPKPENPFAKLAALKKTDKET